MDEALRKLRAGFRTRLPQRLGEVVAAVEGARARPDEPALLIEARRLAHTLKGTASSYGFAEVGAGLEELEEALEALEGISPQGENLKSELRPRAWEEVEAALARVFAGVESG